jgi:hypothetical protein
VAPVLYALFARVLLARPAWVLKRIGPALLALCLVGNLGDIVIIRFDPRNQSYVDIIADLKADLVPGDVVLTSYPQLIANETGCRSIGCTWLAEQLEPIIARHRPDVIVLDAARGGNDYTVFVNRYGATLPGYELVRHRPEKGYIIFRAQTARKPGPEEKTEKHAP